MPFIFRRRPFAVRSIVRHDHQPPDSRMPSKDQLTHFNARGEAHMVDIGGKPVTARKAIAEGCIRMRAATLQMIDRRQHEKGDVLAIARVAGIMAAKRTAELLPLCHPLRLTRIAVELTADPQNNAVQCRATAETRERTGVEMEALTAVQVALLTIYDMCKAADRAMVMHTIRLMHKSGGNSGTWNRDEQ